jgi:hypothetical protein
MAARRTLVHVTENCQFVPFIREWRNANFVLAFGKFIMFHEGSMSRKAARWPWGVTLLGD